MPNEEHSLAESRRDGRSVEMNQAGRQNPGGVAGVGYYINS
jgi:hypothetical protein